MMAPIRVQVKIKSRSIVLFAISRSIVLFAIVIYVPAQLVLRQYVSKLKSNQEACNIRAGIKSNQEALLFYLPYQEALLYLPL